MFDPLTRLENPVSSDQLVQPVEQKEDHLFLQPNTRTEIFPVGEDYPVPYPPAAPLEAKIRVIFLPYKEEKKFLRMPVWLHESIGWGVFLVLLASFLGLQIYLNRLLTSPINQILTILTVVVEINLLWRWDQYWY